MALGRPHSCIPRADDPKQALAHFSSRPVFPWRASLVLVGILETCESAVLKALLAKLINLWGDLLNCLNYWQDDPSAMDFVTSAANLRMHIFSMNMKSRFDIKCKLFVLQLYHLNSKFILLFFFLTANLFFFFQQWQGTLFLLSLLLMPWLLGW